jgi:hypothetical protein
MFCVSDRQERVVRKERTGCGLKSQGDILPEKKILPKNLGEYFKKWKMRLHSSKRKNNDEDFQKIEQTRQTLV